MTRNKTTLERASQMFGIRLGIVAGVICGRLINSWYTVLAVGLVMIALSAWDMRTVLREAK